MRLWASVDGHETGIYRANPVLRALPLEAGCHRIELVYDPVSFKAGIVISLGVLTVSLYILVVAAACGRTRGVP